MLKFGLKKFSLKPSAIQAACISHWIPISKTREESRAYAASFLWNRCFDPSLPYVFHLWLLLTSATPSGTFFFNPISTKSHPVSGYLSLYYSTNKNCQLPAISINNTPESTVVSKYMSFFKITLSKRSQMTVYALFTEKRDMPICLKRRIHTIRIPTEYYIFDCMTSDRKKKLRMKTPRQRTKLKIRWAPNWRIDLKLVHSWSALLCVIKVSRNLVIICKKFLCQFSWGEITQISSTSQRESVTQISLKYWRRVSDWNIKKPHSK